MRWNKGIFTSSGASRHLPLSTHRVFRFAQGEGFLVSLQDGFYANEMLEVISS